MDILAFLATRSLAITQVSATESSSPCPFCGGTDRFRIWPTQGACGKAWCRQCHWNGSLADLLHQLDGIPVRDALRLAGVPPSPSVGHPLPPREKRGVTPRLARLPDPEWILQAEGIVARCAVALEGSAEAVSFLSDRQISLETAKRHRIGYSSPRNALLIPCYTGSTLDAVKARYLAPTSIRYQNLPGSTARPHFFGEIRDKVIVVESELDALLIAQEGLLETVPLALGSASNAIPDLETFRALAFAKEIVFVPDNDPAGEKAFATFRSLFPSCKRKNVSDGVGKDLGEAVQKGLKISALLS